MHIALELNTFYEMKYKFTRPKPKDMYEYTNNRTRSVHELVVYRLSWIPNPALSRHGPLPFSNSKFHCLICSHMLCVSLLSTEFPKCYVALLKHQFKKIKIKLQVTDTLEFLATLVIFVENNIINENIDENFEHFIADGNNHRRRHQEHYNTNKILKNIFLLTKNFLTIMSLGIRIYVNLVLIK